MKAIWTESVSSDGRWSALGTWATIWSQSTTTDWGGQPERTRDAARTKKFSFDHDPYGDFATGLDPVLVVLFGWQHVPLNGQHLIYFTFS